MTARKTDEPARALGPQPSTSRRDQTNSVHKQAQTGSRNWKDNGDPRSGFPVGLGDTFFTPPARVHKKGKVSSVIVGSGIEVRYHHDDGECTYVNGRPASAEHVALVRAAVKEEE